MAQWISFSASAGWKGGPSWLHRILFGNLNQARLHWIPWPDVATRFTLLTGKAMGCALSSWSSIGTAVGQSMQFLCALVTFLGQVSWRLYSTMHRDIIYFPLPRFQSPQGFMLGVLTQPWPMPPIAKPKSATGFTWHKITSAYCTLCLSIMGQNSF